MEDHITYRIEEEYHHEQEKDYVRLYFDMPQDVDGLEVKLHVGNDTDVVDLGLEDESGLRGWSGGARRHLIIKEDWAVDGYGAGEFHVGKWAVLLGLYKIREACRVEIEITIHLKQEKWYKGDLHMHSTHSDGSFSIEQVMENAKKAGLDYIAITDHNTFSQNRAYKPLEKLVVIEGVELTTYHGHVNFWGHPKPISHFACHSKEDMDHYIAEGRANGAMVSVNHPFHTESWNYGMERYDFQYMEIWNGPWSAANQQAVDWWHEQLCKGKRIVAVGGSDTHRQDVDRWYGTPTTWIRTDSFSSEGMLEGIKRGQVCVSASPTAPRVNLSIEDVDMGGRYRVREEQGQITLTCTYKNGNSEILRIYSDQGVLHEEALGTGEGVVCLQLPSDAKFYRAEVRCNHQVVVVSNAIFLS